MSTTTQSSTEEKLNELIEILIPQVNEKIPGIITSSGLDPWEKVLDGSDTVGKINLGVCTAKVKVKYKIRDMTGLSSLELTTGEVTEISSEKDGQVSGRMELKMKLDSKLKADLKGSVEASCGVLSEEVSLSGTGKASSVTGKATLDFGAEIGSSVCLTKASVNQLSLSAGNIDINVDGLGIFNDFLDPIVDLLYEVFGDAIEVVVANAVRPLLNDLIVQELPLCD